MDMFTVKDLMQFCMEQIKKGNGDKQILLSDDEEGNGYHGMYYSFSTVEQAVGDEDYMLPFGADRNKCIILG